MMQQQRGFTLIELIIVIVILGILAVTAAPKFIDIQGDAKAGTIQAVVGSLKSVNTIVHGKALIAGEATKATGGAVTVNTVSTDLVYGYPSDAVDLTTLMDIDSGMEADFESGTGGAAADGQPGDGTSVISFYDYDDANFDYSGPSTDEGCLIIYTEAQDATTPATVTAYTGECN